MHKISNNTKILLQLRSYSGFFMRNNEIWQTEIELSEFKLSDPKILLLNRANSGQGVQQSWKSWKCPGKYFCPGNPGICPGILGKKVVSWNLKKLSWNISNVLENFRNLSLNFLNVLNFVKE